MTAKYLEIASTSAVREARAHYYGKSRAPAGHAADDTLSEIETAFVHARDSFYLATISESGWPYVQHRGGAPGFLRVLDEKTLVFGDYEGNRQMLTAGNLAANSRAALFLMDYPQRARLKILGHARIEDADLHPALAAQPPDARRPLRRIIIFNVVAFDWNCAQHITPRYTAAEVDEAVKPLQRRIAELEARLAGIGEVKK